MGRYWLGPQIGEGATGAIFDGEFGPLRRPVAIKLLHAHLVGHESAGRMLAEARMLSRLDHPGIVKVFDVGEVQGRAFIVMERLTGESLWSRIARQRLSEERIVLFARQIASALEAAHALGIVHRDLKPENVLIVRDPDVPGGERVKLIDFGIAKHEWEGERTATGVVLGTPTYMAPEQWESTVDPRADIYSLGIVIYVMATGELPFSGNTNELLAEHAYCAPPRAAERGLVSSWLSSIIDRCLAKRPNDRFPTMTALVSALRALEHAIAPPATSEIPRFDDDDDADEETTRPGPNAVRAYSDDAATTVVPLAIGTARNSRRSARSNEPTRPRRRRRSWRLAAYVVVVAALFATSVAVLALLGGAMPAAEEPARLRGRYLRQAAPAKAEAAVTEAGEREGAGARRGSTSR